MYMMGYYGFGLGWFGWIFMILCWTVFIAVVVGFIKLIGGGRRGGKTAAEILEERYAKGEITKKSFAEMKKELEE